MSNDSNYDVAVEQNMVVSFLYSGLLNATISGDDIWLLDTVKVCIHGAIFVTTFFLTYLIVVTVCHTAELRRNVRFILLCHHCACVTSFNAVGTVLHGLRALRLPISRLTCWLLFDFQVALGRGMGITLTLMAINTCLSILRPLHYPKLVRRIRASVIALAWFVALLNPVLFTVLACAQSSWAYVVALDPVCSTTLESPASRFSSLALVAFLILLIMTSYVLIYMEGCRAGHFSRSNSYGRRTILIHMLQMILYLLPLVPIIARLKHNMAATVTNYVVFLVGQGLSPVVYGLRSRELRKQLPRFLPRWTKVFQTSSGITDCSTWVSDLLEYNVTLERTGAVALS
ncbi:olfactory receptor 1F12 [Coregonus clupeaformis]|uniref:olfactory receptor 1F12 n=1 Tax=Coregonus clupeaformis TaxID=59861 RepID=UPI001E1C4971|nr:olfactory receptor 1F12 [Coregonus clupeaformis]